MNVQTNVRTPKQENFTNKWWPILHKKIFNLYFNHYIDHNTENNFNHYGLYIRYMCMLVHLVLLVFAKIYDNFVVCATMHKHFHIITPNLYF